MKNRQRVICIGMHKTGTSSLGLALLELGYKVLGARTDLADLLLENQIDQVLETTEPFDALQDVPWALLFKELDQKYPNSKFILTKRNETSWLNSVSAHFADIEIPLHRWIYGHGVAKGQEAVYLEKYRAHYKEVESYFKDRPEDIISIDFAKGDGWPKLCNFLNKEIPNKPFPYANKGKHTLTIGEKLYAKLRSLIPARQRRKILDMLGIPDKRNKFNNHFENKRYREKIKSKKRA